MSDKKLTPIYGQSWFGPTADPVVLGARPAPGAPTLSVDSGRPREGVLSASSLSPSKPKEENVLNKLSGKSALVLAAGAMVLAVAGIANAGGGANNIKNGNFETGTFSPGWNWGCSGCTGTWLVTKKKTTPSGFPWFAPMQGSFSALADEESADTLYLWQKFKVGKPNARLTLIADWNNRSVNGWCNLVLDFDYTAPCGPGLNQQFRIDVLAEGASLDTTDPGDILKTIFQTADNTPLTQGKTKLQGNLGNVKGKVTVRVVVVAGDSVLNVGIDSVNINNGN